MKNTWFKDALTGDFNKNVEIAGRYDGKFNLWQKVVELHEDGSLSQYWEVINVFDTEKEANEALEAIRKAVNRQQVKTVGKYLSP